MDCDILRTLYLKCNGEVLCNDDVGECVSLGAVDAQDPSWSIAQVFDNDKYAHIRASLVSGRVPWDGICQRCAFLRPGIPLRDQLAQRVITKLQVEPSLACNLHCRCCTNREQRKTRSKPHQMPLATYERTLQSLQDEGYSLENIEYCGQGEPLTHPKFHEFVALGRRWFPEARQRLITNGNFDYRATTRGVPLDEIYVSCDGVRQQSYEQYRQNGKVDQALQFMSDAAATVDSRQQSVVWKYILFEFNDSADELREAQLTAARLGIDTLLFTVTSSEHRSQTYTLDTLAELEIVSPNVHVDQCATYHEGAAYGHRQAARFVPEGMGSWLPARRRPPSRAHLDEVVSLPGNTLTLRGWAAATKRLTHVQIFCDDQLVGSAKLSAIRDDVFEVHRHFMNQRAGFYLSAQLTQPLNPSAQISVLLLCEQRRRGRLVTTYQFAPAPEA
ncbi:MAG: hypothetical protein DRI90_03520 [Deltaproteobacteria bacterium]|nr:MAG: hypothetical protein DRI90_03520 [Deltaproteobacteria bacterium]